MKYHTYINRDFKSQIQKPRLTVKNIKPSHWKILLGGLLFVGIILFFISNNATATKSDSSISSNPDVTFDITNKIILPLELPSVNHNGDELENEKSTSDQHWQKVTIKHGDNLAMIFSRFGLSPAQLHNLLQAEKNIKNTDSLKNLLPGQELKFQIHDNELQELVYKVNETKALHFKNDGQEFKTSYVNQALEKRILHATGTIDSSLFVAAQQAGLSDNLTMELANIFGWDIDFALDIRNGDRFAVVYEEFFLNGEKVRNGKILAAEFINQGKAHRSVYYSNADGNSGYYTPDGKNMRKAFLRTPVEFTRISSRFGKRYHPVLNRIRAHNGVDYAAPRGTPVKTTGDGKIVFKGRKGGYGNTIVIQHGNNNQTLYAHLSKFRRGIYTGKTVKQGQVIAYVGSTGLATGPHLHYEFRVNGIHRNPLTVKFPAAAPVKSQNLKDFMTKTNNIITQLDILHTTYVIAMNEEQD